jgi:hypothetical protein
MSVMRNASHATARLEEEYKMIVRPTFSYTNYARLQKFEFLYYLRKFHLLVICICYS